MTYPRNCWYVAAWSHEIEIGKPFAMSVLGDPLVIFRGSSGTVTVLEDRCVHRHAPLSIGRCEGDALRCMYHGLLFNADGAVIEIPGQSTIPPAASVKKYPAVERGGWVWVWMGRADRADERLIPAAIGPDDPDWLLGCGRLDYAAEARLICDNLLDFSHLTYVHANSFGAGDTFAMELPKVTPLERGVRFDRWLTSNPGPVGRRTGELVDGWMRYDFLMPGVLLMWSGVYPVGSAKRFGMGEPDHAAAMAGVSTTSQAVTPMTAKTARYFFSTGPHRDHGDTALRDIMVDVANRAFAEDKTMIEAQQRIIDTDPARPIMPTAADKGVTLFNRMMAKLAEQD